MKKIEYPFKWNLYPKTNPEKSLNNVERDKRYAIALKDRNGFSIEHTYWDYDSHYFMGEDYEFYDILAWMPTPKAYEDTDTETFWNLYSEGSLPQEEDECYVTIENKGHRIVDISIFSNGTFDCEIYNHIVAWVKIPQYCGDTIKKEEIPIQKKELLDNLSKDITKENKDILEELKEYLSLNIEISKQNAEDVYLSTKDSGCANVYLGKMIAFTEALSKLKSLTEEGKTIWKQMNM